MCFPPLICFCVHGLTDLRYFMPLALRMQEHGLTTHWVVGERSGKYNGLSDPANMELLESRVHDLFPSAVFRTLDEARTCVYDTVVNVEVSHQAMSIPHLRLLAIQHFLDHRGLSHLADPSVTYVMWSKACASELRSKGRCLVLPPITPRPLQANLDAGRAILRGMGWDGVRPVATIFYPQEADRLGDAAQAFHDTLGSAGTFVVAKQRKKHGGMPKSMEHQAYDRMWYPSESIALPLLSSVSVCLGSSVHLELEEMGLRCIEHPVPGHSRDHPRGPNGPTFLSDLDLTACLKKANEWALLPPIVPRCISDDEIDDLLFNDGSEI